MAGLGTQQPQQGGMQQRPAQPAPAPMNQEPMDEAGGGNQATEEEQAAYDEFAETLADVLYPRETPGEVFPQILANLKGEFDQQMLALFEGVDPALTNSPQDAVSATAVLIILVIDKKMGLIDLSLAANEERSAAPQPNIEPDEDGMIELDEPAEPEFSPEAVLMEGGKLVVEELIEVSEAAGLHDFQEQDIEGTFYRALDLFRVAQEKVNPNVVAALQRGFEEIRMADEQGQLGKVLPGLPGGAPMQQQEA